MKLLHKFFSLAPDDRLLLIKAAFVLGLIRIGLLIFSFNTMRSLLARAAGRPIRLRGRGHPSSDRIVWAVTVAGRYMLKTRKCLVQAMTAHLLFARNGRRSSLHIGVAKTDGGKLEAHAWLKSKDEILIGNLKNLSRYTPLPVIEKGRM